jgi:hypothetical protein
MLRAKKTYSSQLPPEEAAPRWGNIYARGECVLLVALGEEEDPKRMRGQVLIL